MLPPINETKVIHTHVGFRPGHTMKRLVVPYTPAARHIFGSPIFAVVEQNELSKYALGDPRQHEYVFRGSMSRNDGDFGRHFVGDFSALTTPGVYQAFNGNEPGVPFVIHDQVWCRLLPMLLSYMKVQSCGREVPTWHAACHLDDGYVRETQTYLEAAGGWHDAGDFRKWASSTSMHAIVLLLAHRMWGGRETELGLDPGVFLAAARHGVRYFLNIQDRDTGAVWHSIGSGAESFHDNLDCRYTDNLKYSGDERRIHPGFTTPAAKMTTMFALYANQFADNDPELAAACLAAALLSAKYDAAEGEDDTHARQWRAWGFLEIWRHSRAAEHQDAAWRAMRQLLERQVTEYIGGQEQVRGFFYGDADREVFHRKHTGADQPAWILQEFLDAWPDHPDAGRWRDALAMWAYDYAAVMAERNAFGLTPYSFYTEPSPDHPDYTYRRLGDGLYFRYFLAGREGLSNPRLNLAAAGLAAAARILARPDLASYGYRLLEWTTGNNPFQLSTVVGVGPYQMVPFSPLMGPIPGGVTNGFGGDREDLPCFHCHPWASPPECSEFYGYNTSHFLWALLALQRCPL